MPNRQRHHPLLLSILNNECSQGQATLNATTAKMAEAFFQLQKEGILKKVLYGGEGNLPDFPDGAKVCSITVI